MKYLELKDINYNNLYCFTFIIAYICADLRIKQEPVAMTDRERAEKLAERLSGEVYTGGRGFDSGHYGSNSDHMQPGGQIGPPMVRLPLAHPPTPDLSPAPTNPAMWNTKMKKAGTVSTPHGESDFIPIFKIFKVLLLSMYPFVNLIFDIEIKIKKLNKKTSSNTLIL